MYEVIVRIIFLGLCFVFLSFVKIERSRVTFNFLFKLLCALEANLIHFHAIYVIKSSYTFHMNQYF